MNKMLTLSALLLAGLARRGEGDPAPSNTGAPTMTEEEWQSRNETKYAKANLAELIKKVTTLERQNETLKESQVPKGARVLSEAEAKDYEAYVALGKPADVKKQVEDGARAQASLGERETGDRAREAAEAAGFKQKVLLDRAGADKLEILPVRDVERDGKTVKVAYVKDSTGAEHEVTEYAKKHWGDYLPALTAGSSTSSTASTTGVAVNGKQDSTASTSGGGGSWVKDILKKSGESTTGGYVDPLQVPKPAAAQ